MTAAGDTSEIADSARLGLSSCRKVARTQSIRFWRVPGLDGVYDGGHGADQPPESFDCPGFAGDVDAGV